MKTQQFKYVPLALAVAALFSAPLAFADPEGGLIIGNGDDGGTHDFKLSAAVNLSGDVSTTENYTKVKIEKDLKYKQDITVKGKVDVHGNAFVDSSSAAVIDDMQINYLNNGTNDENKNSAVVDGNALNGAKGNIGVNVTAGDSNQQANAVALSAADASFVFSSSDAEIFARQDAQSNHVTNYGSTNNAALGGSALANASGNIGVNISAGNNNQQKNDLAASVAVARIATATLAVKQMNDHNTTSNTPKQQDSVVYVPVTLALQASGKYSGIADQKGNQYPDIWTGSTHPSGTQIGHVDLDTQVQGAVDRPVHAALDSNGNPTGATSTGGAFSFNEEGDVALRGSVTGNIPVVYHLSLATTNTASFSGNALMGASGNIGVNIASGTNNQQYNGLAMSVSQAGARTGGGGGSGGNGEQ